MRFRVSHVALLILVIVSGSAVARDNRRDRKKIPRYMVIQCRDSTGAMTFEVIETERLKERQKACEEEFKELARDWVAGAREAKKNGEKYGEPKPIQPYAIRCKYAKSSYKTEEEAQKFADNIQAAYDKKLEERRRKAAAKRGEDFDDFGGGDDDDDKDDKDDKDGDKDHDKDDDKDKRKRKK
ncbi:hypothetical protein HQ560_02135 [bacterium]|nr:hypothetical protein [bacterium]